MYNIKVTGAEKIYIQATGQWQLAVDFDIMQVTEGSDPVVMQHYSHGFDLDTDKETIKSNLKDVLDAYVATQQRAEQNKVFDEANDKADSTIADVVGLDITS